MSDMSDPDIIRNKRLAKLGTQPAATNNEDDGGVAASSAPDVLSNISSQVEQQSISVAPNGTEPQSNSYIPASMVPESAGDGLVNSDATGRPSTPATLDKGGTTTSTSQQSKPKQSPETEEHRMLSGIFRVTLDAKESKDAHGHELHYLPGVREDLEADNAPLRLTTSILDQAILEAASNLQHEKPLDYLLGCWKRVSKQFRSVRGDNTKSPRYEILKEARRLCMSYCIFAATMPDMFGQEASEDNPLVEHLLVDPDNDRGVCHDFLSEAVARFQEDDCIKDALVDAMCQVSRRLANISMNDDYKPYVLALRNLVRYPALVDAITKSPAFLPSDIAAQDIETASLLGPFFRLSPLQGEVALNYFSNPKTQDRGYIANSQRALRLTLSTHQTDLLDIANCIIKAAKEPRERMLDWFALTVNANHKRRAMQVDPKTTSSDGFMINVTVCLDGLCEPFMDATFSKVDRIDVNYLRRSPRVLIQDETKLNADQQTSDRFYSQKLEGTNNFISEVFFLAVAAHHYGTEAANSKIKQLRRHIDFMEKEIERLEAQRPQYAATPMSARYEAALRRFKDDVEKTHCVLLSIQGVLLDEVVQARSMLFMRYVIVWMLRLVEPSYPQKEIHLPLPPEEPEVFRCLPEYFLEDVVDNFKFITRNMPQIITSTQCDELVTICITFLRSSEYIKNPYLKSGLVTILFSGIWPQWNRSKGVLGDLLNSMPFALKHLLHALMKFFIEAEFTGTHGQFYDKFNIRYEIFQIIRCIWSNAVYRENLATEAMVNLDFFVRFVNLLLNDVTFVLDESFTSFEKIHDLNLELHSPETLSEQEKQEKEEALEAAKGKAKSYMQLTNETVSMLKLFTEALADSFTMPEIVDRLAAMLNYNLDALAGPRQSNLRVENPQEYNFNPKQLISDIVDVYLNLGSKPSFELAVVRDGRSYKPNNFTQASHILSKFGLKAPSEITAWDAFAHTLQKVKEADDQAEEDLGEIPDEFLDPLLATLMEDPVTLPTSRQVVDRSTIRSHLLSDPNDPFNRSPLKIEDVVPNTELKERIQAFKKEKKGRKVAEAMEAMEEMDTSQG